MSDSAALLSGLVEDDRSADHATAALRSWAEPARAELRRAGLLRGLAQLGTVLWAAGLAWAAQRGLDVQAAHRIPVAVAPGVALVVGGIALRALLLDAAESAADHGARTVRERVRSRLLDTALPTRGPSRTALPDAAVAEAVTREVARLTDWLTDYVPARTAMLVGSGTVLAAIAVRSWFVALLLLAATPLLPMNLKVIGLGTQAVVRAQLSAVRRHSTRLLDHLRGLPTLIGLGAEDSTALALREDDEELARRTESVLRVAFLSTAWIELLITGSLAVVATYCGLVLLDYLRLPLVPDHMTLGQAMFVLVLTPAYFAPARDLARGYHSRAEARAAADLLTEALGGPDAEPTPDAVLPEGGTSPVGVLLEGVSVRFAGREAPALEEVSLAVEPGEVLALTGASGAGKSTLLAVAAGLTVPGTGRVAHVVADGTVTPSPTAVAWVGQPARLFAGTVRENLLLARQEAAVTTDAQLEAAFAALGLADLLDALPQRLDTRLGERGHGLSSGQLQQVALVRALLRDAPLLVLDEPTAHLDVCVRARVIAAVRTLARGRTVLLATHDPGLLPFADRVLELSRGRLR
ncbi:ATP-binding cassette domain-containing protein [Streptacidiphilus fuscans]|uniref:ATP-binding cassette domain-containing protein n=1 Tax=Streptacidiphilus fuscans TaxID=2789292 RepID=A0A931AWD1_9ACTN|nr:ATP-binding cassette domain-containing protein [Streptacidiphilus fuscans]MBF9066689.1 ATP-binding cassette domain-containing protein [Streptacidiphilus fuscans]